MTRTTFTDDAGQPHSSPGGCCDVLALAADLINALLAPCSEPPAQEEGGEPGRPIAGPGSHGPGIVDACLAAFAEVGDPEAMASEDLVSLLRQAPGYAVGRWRFTDLTQARLAHLLAPYEVTTRDATLPDGRRRKSYRLSALLAACEGTPC